MIQHWFDKLDVNNDGQITREEWRTGWQTGVVAFGQRADVKAAHKRKAFDDVEAVANSQGQPADVKAAHARVDSN